MPFGKSALKPMQAMRAGRAKSAGKPVFGNRSKVPNGGVSRTSSSNSSAACASVQKGGKVKRKK